MHFHLSCVIISTTTRWSHEWTIGLVVTKLTERPLIHSLYPYLSIFCHSCRWCKKWHTHTHIHTRCISEYPIIVSSRHLLLFLLWHTMGFKRLCTCGWFTNLYKVLLTNRSILGLFGNNYCARNVCSHPVTDFSLSAFTHAKCFFFFSKMKVLGMCGFAVGRIAAV